MATSWMRRSVIGSLIIVRYRKRRELPSGVWSPAVFQLKEKREITPEVREHLTYNTCNTKMNFGEYNGVPLGALPTDYLLYLANDFFSEEIHHWRYYRDMAKEVLRERKSLEITKRKEGLQRIIHAGRVEDALEILRDDCNQADRPVGYAQLLIYCAKHKSLEHGNRVHDCLRLSGFSRNSYLGELLIVMYSKCERLDLAHQVFEELPKKLISSWTTMIRCYMEHGKDQDALNLYKKIDVQPDGELMVSMFDCCGNLKNLDEGKVIHACLLSSEVRPSLRVRTAVFRFYARCGDVNVASKLFLNLEEKHLRCWNLLIEAYVSAGQAAAAFELYGKLDLAPDADTFLVLLPACSTMEQLNLIYADMAKNKLHFHPRVWDTYKRVQENLRKCMAW